MNSSIRSAAVALIAAGAAMLLVACGTPESEEEDMLTLVEAKRATQAQELVIFARISGELVGEIEQAPEGTVMPCPTSGEAQWAGRSLASVADPSRYEVILQSLAAEFEATSGFDVDRSPAASGEPRVHLVGNAGEGYILGPRRAQGQLEILSFSPCFALKDGERTGQSY